MDVPGTDVPRPVRPELGAWPAAALVFGSSAAVLVVELRRAPSPGAVLRTDARDQHHGHRPGVDRHRSGHVGRWMDRGPGPPRGLIGPLLGVSGAVVAATPVLVRGAAAGAGDLLVLVAALTILVPGALLSAVSPVVIKLRLTSLDETGSTVGRLSGLGTVGSIFGTVLTGFVLISRVPVSGILVGLGVLLLATSVLVASPPAARGARDRPGRRRAAGRPRRRLRPEWLRHRDDVPLPRDRRGPRPSLRSDPRARRAAPLLRRRRPDAPRVPVRPGDGLRHRHGLPRRRPPRRPTTSAQARSRCPRYVAATRPGSDNRVSEIDGGVVDAAAELLG